MMVIIAKEGESRFFFKKRISLLSASERQRDTSFRRKKERGRELCDVEGLEAENG